VEWQIVRCETAKKAWRDEFAGLVGFWLQCWLAGMSREDTNAECQISKTEGEWLRKEVQKWIRLGPPQRTGLQKKPERQMKKGVANDIIRKRKMNYKHGQVLTPQQVNPFTQTGTPIKRGI
jgi:hypothetical protein